MSGRVNQEVQPLVRAVLSAVVDRNAAAFEVAMRSIPADVEVAAEELVIAIDAYVVDDLHDGEPQPDDLQAMAESFREMEDWFESDLLHVDGFLSALVRPEEARRLDRDQAVLAAYLVGGWLLAAYLPEGKEWWQYLNEVLDSLDSAPLPS